MTTAGETRWGWRRALAVAAVWAALAGLLATGLLVAHILVLTPAELARGPSPVRVVVRLAVVATAISLPPLALVAIVYRRRRPLVTAALLIALLPALVTWPLFGFRNGHADPLAALLLLLSVGGGSALSCFLAGRSWLGGAARPPVAAVLALLAVVTLTAAAGPPSDAPEAGAPDPTSAPEPGSTARPPRALVLLTIDTLRADHLGVYGYRRATSPNIDRLAGEGRLFEEMLAASSGTVPAFATILTGVYPVCHGVSDQLGRIGPGVATLAERLSAAGYRSFAVVSNRLLSEEAGFARGFDDYANLGDVPAAKVVAAASQRLDAAGPGPLFAWIHLMDPHTPYAPPADRYRDLLGDESYSTRELKTVDFGSYGGVKVSRVLGDDRPAGAPVEGEIVARYDGEIRAADAAVGELVELLSRRYGPDEVAIFLVSDHGETLVRSERDPYFQHALDVYQSTLHVPAILWAPSRVDAGSTEPTPTHHIDVVPTLLGLAGESAEGPPSGGPAPVGVDLARQSPGRRELISQTAWWDALSLKLLPARQRQPVYAVIAEGAKLIRRPRSELLAVTGPRSWLHAWRSTVARFWRDDALYDLRADAAEANNRIGGEAREDTLDRALERHLRAPLAPGCGSGDPSREQTERTQEKLRALGYLD